MFDDRVYNIYINNDNTGRFCLLRQRIITIYKLDIIQLTNIVVNVWKSVKLIQLFDTKTKALKRINWTYSLDKK